MRHNNNTPLSIFATPLPPAPLSRRQLLPIRQPPRRQRQLRYAFAAITPCHAARFSLRFFTCRRDAAGGMINVLQWPLRHFIAARFHCRYADDADA